MRYPVLFFVSIVLFSGACKHREQKIDIPDISGINSNMDYLDSLLQSEQVDSIATMITGAESLVTTRLNPPQSPDEVAILDSVTNIISYSSEFLRFCIDSRTNIELLRQDIALVEAQHKSGRINTGQFIRSLMESEQIMVEINNRFENEREDVMNSLRNIGSLQAMLSPLSVQEQN